MIGQIISLSELSESDSFFLMNTNLSSELLNLEACKKFWAKLLGYAFNVMIIRCMHLFSRSWRNNKIFRIILKLIPRLERQIALNCKMTLALASLRHIKDFLKFELRSNVLSIHL